jgi:CTP synthase
MSPDGQLVEMIERSGHPWFVGCQFHPELKSRPNRAHPSFASFVEAAATVQPGSPIWDTLQEVS